MSNPDDDDWSNDDHKKVSSPIDMQEAIRRISNALGDKKTLDGKPQGGKQSDAFEAARAAMAQSAFIKNAKQVVEAGGPQKPEKSPVAPAKQWAPVDVNRNDDTLKQPSPIPSVIGAPPPPPPMPNFISGGPPPPPPPVPNFNPEVNIATTKKVASDDSRDAFLQSIRNGVNLKETITNDRSTLKVPISGTNNTTNIQNDTVSVPTSTSIDRGSQDNIMAQLAEKLLLRRKYIAGSNEVNPDITIQANQSQSIPPKPVFQQPPSVTKPNVTIESTNVAPPPPSLPPSFNPGVSPSTPMIDRSALLSDLQNDDPLGRLKKIGAINDRSDPIIGVKDNKGLVQEKLTIKSSRRAAPLPPMKSPAAQTIQSQEPNIPLKKRAQLAPNVMPIRSSSSTITPKRQAPLPPLQLQEAQRVKNVSPTLTVQTKRRAPIAPAAEVQEAVKSKKRPAPKAPKRQHTKEENDKYFKEQENILLNLRKEVNNIQKEASHLKHIFENNKKAIRRNEAIDGIATKEQLIIREMKERDERRAQETEHNVRHRLQTEKNQRKPTIGRRIKNLFGRSRKNNEHRR